MTKGSKVDIDWDIRFFRRYPKKIDFDLNVQGRNVPARTLDYSLIGVGAVIDDDAAPVAQDDLVSFDIDELKLHEGGKVAWMRKTVSGVRIGILRAKPLRGNFRLYPLSDVLIGLQRTLKTGVLDVRQGGVKKKIYIRAGDVISASSNYEKDRLGDVLLKARRINRRQYDKAAEIKSKTGGRYTAILVHMGYLRASDVIGAAELQARRIIGSLFAMREADFEFTEGPLPARKAITLHLSIGDLIYRALKKNADVELLESYLLESVVDFSSDPLNLFQNIHFTAADRALISCIDGKTTIGDLIRLFPNSRLNPLKIIYALLEARFLKIKGKNESPSGMSAGEILGKGEKGEYLPDAEIERLHSECGKLDYYHILGVGRESTTDTIKKAYYAAARKYHPDMHLDLSEDMKEKVTEIFTYVSTAFLTLADPAKRSKYDRLITHVEIPADKSAKPRQDPPATEEKNEKEGDTPQPEDIGSPNGPDIASRRFADGKVAFWDKNYEKAAYLFAAALSSDGSVAQYHYYYGTSLGMLGRIKEAVLSLNRANELKPMDSAILAELGHVYHKLGFPVRARGYFDRALKLDSSNRRAREGHKLMSGRKHR